MPAKVLCVGLDGAEAELVRGGIEAGWLPSLRALSEQGSCGELWPPPCVSDHGIWTSFYSGRSPGTHGRSFVSQIRSGSYDVRPRPQRDFDGGYFWDALSRAGRRVAVVDVPKCEASADVLGVHLANWIVHTGEPLTVSSAPAELAGEVVARHGEDPLPNCFNTGRSVDEYAAFRDLLVERVEAKTRLLLDLLERDDWDLLLGVYAGAHCVGHECWHLHDASHPLHDADVTARVGDPVRDVYAALDLAVGALVEHAGPDATVIVFSPMGMASGESASPVLDDVLRRLDGEPPVGRGATGVARALWRTLPLDVQKRRKPRRLADAMFAAERSRRPCFAVPNNDAFGAIRLNRVGREPEGRLHPGPECEAFCQQLERDLLDLVEVESGEPVVETVKRREEFFGSNASEDLPDLFVIWRRGAPIRGVESAKVGRLAVPQPAVSGNHLFRGFYLAQGPGCDAQPGANAAIEDLAPTIGALLGVSFEGLDGAPIASVVGGSRESPHAGAQAGT